MEGLVYGTPTGDIDEIRQHNKFEPKEYEESIFFGYQAVRGGDVTLSGLFDIKPSSSWGHPVVGLHVSHPRCNQPN